MAWPAWALAHFSNLFFSNAVNVPFGANLMSNTSGTLVGVVLSPITWLWGPVVSTNVALTLIPGLSAWGCWVAVRRMISWKPGAIPAALVYGYSSAIVTSLVFAHVSVTVLPIPPLLLVTLHAICVGQARTPLRDGVVLAALVAVQFLLSPEVLVMCALLGVIGLAAAAAVGWRVVHDRLPYAARALGIGVGAAAVLLAYPVWFGLAGPQSVSGVLFVIAPLSGVVASGYLSPGPYRAFANAYVRFGGYVGRIGPPPNFVGWGLGVSSLASLVLARLRPLVWLLAFMTFVTVWLSLGSYVFFGPRWLNHYWLPWRTLSKFPVLKEILPDQFAPYVPLFLAFLLAIGLDAAHRRFRYVRGWRPSQVRQASVALTVGVTIVALAPVFVTFDMPFTVQPTAIPVYVLRDVPRLADNRVLLTVPFAVSGSDAPMLWQAVDGMHFRLAGGALKTPDAHGGPIAQGPPGSARRILSDLTLFGNTEPRGTPKQYAAVRQAVRRWHVDEVVIDGESRDPVYAAGFLTAALGVAPTIIDSAWVWKVPPTRRLSPAVTNTSLVLCRAGAAGTSADHDPLAIARCILQNPDRG